MRSVRRYAQNYRRQHLSIPGRVHTLRKHGCLFLTDVLNQIKQLIRDLHFFGTNPENVNDAIPVYFIYEMVKVAAIKKICNLLKFFVNDCSLTIIASRLKTSEYWIGDHWMLWLRVHHIGRLNQKPKYNANRYCK